MKDGKKKERSERSVWSGERCVGRFSQLPTLLWIFRFKGFVFFFRALRKHDNNNNKLGLQLNVYTQYIHTDYI